MTGHEVAFLRADDESDRTAWLAAWRECSREPFAHPTYVELFARASGEQARCLVVRSGPAVAVLPFVLRPVPDECQGRDALLSDAISPYGYGGPYGTTEDLTARVWSFLADWMRAEGVVSMFGRLALGAGYPADLPAGATVKAVADNIVVDLTRSGPEQWLHYEHKVRKNVKKALQAELSVTIQPQFTDLAEFVALYSHTMSRRDADEFYKFELPFFERLQQEMAENCVAAEVRDQTGRLVSAELVLASDRFMYSYLGGTHEDAFPTRPNDLLKHEVINFGRATGRQGYVLGGGYQAGDGIFRYKRSFDPTGAVPFKVLTYVADQQTYALLTAAHDRGRTAGAEVDEGFFPAYRRPAPDESTHPEGPQGSTPVTHG